MMALLNILFMPRPPYPSTVEMFFIELMVADAELRGQNRSARRGAESFCRRAGK